MTKPGTTTLHWIHFGVAASTIIASLAGLLPIPFGVGVILATAASEGKNVLIRKQTDQEKSME
jgi:uncharacterized membrane protein